MNDAMKVKLALEGRADTLEAEASQMVEQDRNARENVSTAAMQVFIKQQVAQEFRNLAGQIGIL